MRHGYADVPKEFATSDKLAITAKEQCTDVYDFFGCWRAYWALPITAAWSNVDASMMLAAPITPVFTVGALLASGFGERVLRRAAMTRSRR